MVAFQWVSGMVQQYIQEEFEKKLEQEQKARKR